MSLIFTKTYHKAVLDVGCGTAILSMFASQAGARVVYAVDSSDIINQAKQIVLDNGFKDKVICIQGRVCILREH